ncbi:MAG: glycosyltransferase family 2 protein [Gammaproteobacteria bacterium]|nr:MAG: glycosyltransferase family 2 protein [Gammaproteobacteria bacterium]
MSQVNQLMQNTFLVSYFLVLGLLCLYALHRYYLVFLFYKHKSRHFRPAVAPSMQPIVTLQIPIFNERYVIGKLLDSIRRLDYPRDRLEVQVLDDSTDDTPQLVQPLIEEMRREGINIHHLRRSERNGYKAGALAEGLAQSQGEFIAIFDADFRPPPEFLKQILPYFRDDRVGMVQARWGYLNRDYSLLTRLQAMFLDAHFMIEHFARNRSGRFFNFNGTAGIWRKTCLNSAGGWQADTLTEDLDISYRAQLQGWRFVFAPEIVVPSELPVEIVSFKTQQHRWAKGSIQTAAKLLHPILTSSYSWKVKLEACFHLTANFSYLLMIFLSLAMLPSMLIRYQLGWHASLWIELPMLLLATPSVAIFYITAQRLLGKKWYHSILYIPMLMGLGIGLAVNNGRAVLEVLFGINSEFKRTPKHGMEGNTGSWMNKRYWGKLDFSLVLEILMANYFLFTLHIALQHELYIAVPFLLLFLFGFAYISLISLLQGAGSFYRRRWQARTVLNNESG